ncbi:MAG: M23 family metallopeptidase, partial [Patescibacteria group bacterium]
IINHNNGYVTLYAHLQSAYVVAGQSVRRGDAIGKMGSTGRSTGPHLHFEVRRAGANLSPLNFLR